MTDIYAQQDFALNELNKKNTYEGSEVVELVVGEIRIGMGFWPTTVSDGTTHPIACLIAWTPEGWEMIDKMPQLYNDNLGMDMSGPVEDLENYMWFIGEVWSKPLLDYLKSKGESVEVMESWRKVLKLMATARIEDGRLEFDRKL